MCKKPEFVTPEGFVVDPDTGEVIDDTVLDSRAPPLFSPEEFLKKSHWYPVNMFSFSSVGTVKKRDPLERALRNVNKHISKMTYDMGLPSWLAQDAMMLAKKVIAKRIVRAKATEIASACIFLSARMNGYVLSLKRNTQHLGTPRRILNIAYIISQHLSLPREKMKPPSPLDFVSKFISILKLPPKVALEAHRLYREIMRKNSKYFQGKNPLPVAVALVILAAKSHNIRISITQACRELKVAPGTTATRYREIRKLLGLGED